MRPAVILLSTHNGERFLAAQLGSILAQTHTEWRLVVRDDASTDRTPEILKAFAERDSRVELMPGGDRLGPPLSFGRLLENAPSADFYFWCDQDDIWPCERMGKMIEGFQAMHPESAPDAPGLLHTDLRLVDEGGRELSRSLHQRYGIGHVANAPLGFLIPQNFVSGCASVFNDALRQIASPIPEDAISHDWWLALMAAAVGRIHYLNETLIDYRRHSENVSQLRRMTHFRELALMRGGNSPIRRRMIRRYRQSLALERRLEGQNPGCAALGPLREWNQAWARGGLGAAAASVRHGIRLQRFLRTLFFRLQLLLCRPAGDE